MDILGTSDSDVLAGTDDNDVISGLSGADVLDGGLGEDVLDGGAGDDSYIVRDRFDHVYDSGGIDPQSSLPTSTRPTAWLRAGHGRTECNVCLTGLMPYCQECPQVTQHCWEAPEPSITASHPPLRAISPAPMHRVARDLTISRRRSQSWCLRMFRAC